MKLDVHFKNGEILVFHDRPETCKEMDDRYKSALSCKRTIVLICTNGDFLINPHEISYVKGTSDQQLEPDEKG
jgi:hypothetical protein